MRDRAAPAQEHCVNGSLDTRILATGTFTALCPAAVNGLDAQPLSGFGTAAALYSLSAAAD